MKKIIIKCFLSCKTSTIGAFKYLHLIQFSADGHGYSTNITHECMTKMITIFKEAGYDVEYSENE